MSYSAPNTPNPTLATQIGYSSQLNITFTPPSATDSLITPTFAFPIGVWIICSYTFCNGNGPDKLLSSELLISTPSLIIGGAGYSSITPFSNIYLPLNATFYSDGSTILNIQLNISLTSIGGFIQSNLTFTKIA
jgi:hypothetical protein